MKTKFIGLLLVLLSGMSYAQQDAQYTQYMYNTIAVNPAYAGKSLAEIAKIENKLPAHMLVELIARIDDWEKKNGRECQENIMATSMSEEDIKKLMQWPHTNICSDGSSGGTHPRGYGAFTRVLGNYVKKEKTLTMSQAIYKMTGLSAQQMGIKKRGLIKTGY